MQAKVFLTSMALILATTVSASAVCPGKSEQAMSCADGMTWDHETGTCVAKTTS